MGAVYKDVFQDDDVRAEHRQRLRWVVEMSRKHARQHWYGPNSWRTRQRPSLEPRNSASSTCSACAFWD